MGALINVTGVSFDDSAWANGCEIGSFCFLEL